MASPIGLIKGFGWNENQLFMQQDVHEFCCILLDAIEKKSEKAVGCKNFVIDLFEGEMQ